MKAGELRDEFRGKLLIYGIGNPGRQDDGVGVRLVEALQEACEAERGRRGDSLSFESGYQLVPEDALSLSERDAVIFVDATVDPEASAPYGLRPVEPAPEFSLSTHSVTLGALVTLCQKVFGRSPRAYALAIPAYEFEVNEPLSLATDAHLRDTLSELLEVLKGSGHA